MRERDDVHDCDLKVEVGLALVESLDVKVFKLFLRDVEQVVRLAFKETRLNFLY